MRTSKVTTTMLRIAVLATVAAGSLGCEISKPKSAKSLSASTFQITRIEGTAKDNVISSTYGFPETKSVTFVTCLADVKFNRPVQNQKFSITETKQVVETDAAGCMSWTEIMPFDFLADSKYITVERKIRSEGLQVGELNVSFAVNLWSHGENLPAVQDPARVDPQFLMTDTQKSKQYSVKNSGGQLWIESGRINVLETVVNTQASFNIQFKTVPQVILKKMNGEIIYRPFTVGEFDTRLTWIHVINSEGKESRRVIAQTDWMKATMNSAALGVPADLVLKEIPTRGNIFIGVQLKTTSKQHDMKPFEGLFLLGDYANIKTSPFLISSVISTNDPNFTIDGYIKASSTLTKYENNFKKAKIEFTELDLTQVWIESETTTSKVINFRVHTCPFNNVDFRPMVNQKYIVEAKGETKTQMIPVESDNQGCLNFRDSMEFKVFECPHYIQKTYKFKNSDIGLNEEIPVLINPWLDGFGFAVDPRFSKLTEKIKTTCGADKIAEKTKNPFTGRNEIKLERYSHSTKAYDFEIDHKLNLFLNKKVQLTIDPKVINFESATQGRNLSHDLRDGLYLLKYAVVKNKSYPQENSVFEASEKIVQSIAHSITAEINFRSDQLKAISNRDQIVIEIYPIKEALVEFANDEYRPRGNLQMNDIIDHDAGLTPVAYYGNFTLNVDEQVRPLWRVSDKEIASWFLEKSKTRNPVRLIDQLKVELEAQKSRRQALVNTQSQKQFFAGSHRLYMTDLEKARGAASPLETATGFKSLVSRAGTVTFSDLQLALTKKEVSPSLATKLCEFWIKDIFRNQIISLGYTQDLMIRDCKLIVEKQPEKFFNIQKHIFAKESSGSFKVGTNEGLNVGTSFSLSRTLSKSFTQSISAAAKIGLAGKVFEFISLGTDVQGSISWAKAEADADATATSVGTTTTLMVQKNSFDVTIKQGEICLSIKAVSSQFAKTPGLFGSHKFGAYFKEEVSEEQRAEVINRGLLICEGKTRDMNEVVKENYYLINQEFTPGQIQDSGDERNKPFFMALRSDAEYLRFKTAIQSNLRHGKTDTKDKLDRPLDLESTVHMIQDTRKLSGAGVYTY